jgi:hypothetical protein
MPQSRITPEVILRSLMTVITRRWRILDTK